MKKLLFMGLSAMSLVVSTATTIVESSVFKKVEILGNIIIVREDNNEFVIPIVNIVSLFKNGDDKTYYIRYYGHYDETSKVTEIDKDIYEKLKKVLMKTEQ